MTELPQDGLRPTASHWGTYEAEVRYGRLVALHPFEKDPDPSPIGQNLVDGVYSGCRIEQPMVRAGYLEHGHRSDTAGRGAEPFVPVSWELGEALLAGELLRVKQTHGNQAIYAGSYGWASAGRFHHALSQLHRFMNLFGGYTASVNTYSFAAAEVIVPRVAGNLGLMFKFHTAWPVIAEHSELVVAFGGMPLKNAQINSGGVGAHTTRSWLERCAENGVDFVNIGPLRDDLGDFLDAEWLRPRPNTDTAIMLGLAHTLLVEDLHDEAFLAGYCVGFERFHPYLLGEADGQPKDADWAAAISGLDADTLRALARRMAAKRTMLCLSWSLQRAEHGEQPYWMAITLAAMLGQIGLPGGGFGFGYGASHGPGNPTSRVGWASLSQGRNPVGTYIPVARISDMLLNPGQTIDYDGKRITFPDIRLVYWAGGNPLHHHQDINRLVEALRRPETIVVHEPWWTPFAKHADIVLPATTALERNDIACARDDGFAIAMHQAIEPVGEARNDHRILAGLAERLGFHAAFTEGRDEMEWLRHFYEISRQQAARDQIELPDFETFWQDGHVELPPPAEPPVLFRAFRDDPEADRLGTPSGKIEIFSETIDGFGYDDCPGHPTWLEPDEWLGAKRARTYPLHLISNQPKTRLHSQIDCGRTSRASKLQGREPARLHPDDAARRGIADGDVIRVFNDRGACLAGVTLSEDVRPGVIQLSTGAWYDPLEPGKRGSLDKHGNPNMLTRDKGCSRLSQGPAAHSALVEVERYDGELPEITAFRPPPIEPGR